jgi:hypothetical protein
MKRLCSLCVVLALVLSACASTGGPDGNYGGNPAAQPAAQPAAAAAQPAAAQPAAPSAPARNISGRVPDFVREAVRNAPEDALVGIGTANLSSISQSRTIAATRARAEISRQVDTVIRDMIRDFQATSEADPDSTLAFQENITLALSQSRLQGSSVVDEDRDQDGNYWCVVMLTKGEAVREINQAVAQAKLRVPAAASFDAEKRMNEGFDLLAEEEIQVVDR